MAGAKYWVSELIESKDYAEKAKIVSKERKGKQQNTYCTALSIIAWFYQSLGDYEMAKDNYENIIRICDK